MLRIPIDCDVLLNVALKRQPHFALSLGVLDWAVAHPFSASVAWHSLSNFAYIFKTDPRPFLKKILTYAVVPPSGTIDAERALSLAMADFEDALQVAAAERFGAEYIVTRNTDDFTASSIRAITPAEFVHIVGPRK